LEHVPHYWNEDKIKERCEEYGNILNVDLFQISKNMKSETFSFVEFSSSKSTLACVEGINNARIVDGSLKVSYVLFSRDLHLVLQTC
jgi:RNA recognition motif-containing protein